MRCPATKSKTDVVVVVRCSAKMSDNDADALSSCASKLSDSIAASFTNNAAAASYVESNDFSAYLGSFVIAVVATAAC